MDKNINDFDVHESLNDFIQINDDKIVFMYMAIMANSFINKLGIIIIDTNELNNFLYPRYFYINFENYTRPKLKDLLIMVIYYLHQVV